MTNQARSGTALRAHRRQRTKDEIRVAAIRLFSQKGFGAVTLEEITLEAMVSQRTFFRYFTGKEDVLLDSQSLAEAIRDALLARPADEDPKAALRNAASTVALAMQEANREYIPDLLKIFSENPELILSATAYMIGSMGVVIDALGQRMKVDPETDVRPTVYVGTTMIALMASTRLWIMRGLTGNFTTIFSRAVKAMDEL